MGVFVFMQACVPNVCSIPRGENKALDLMKLELGYCQALCSLCKELKSAVRIAVLNY